MLKNPSGLGQHEEFKAILLRSSMNPDDMDDSLEICVTHQRILGHDFARLIHNDFCYYKNHVGDRKGKASRHITYDQSVKALGIKDLDLPFGMPVCENCEKNLVRVLEKESINSESSDHASDVQAISDALDASFISQDSSASVESSASSSQQTQNRKGKTENVQNITQKQRILEFNNFLKACEEQIFEGRQHLKKVLFEDADESRQMKLLKAFASGIIAILKTITEIEGEEKEKFRNCQ